jgi:hypothetical protein
MSEESLEELEDVAAVVVSAAATFTELLVSYLHLDKQRCPAVSR